MEILIDPTETSTIGFTEALKNLNVHLANLKTLKKVIDREKPDALFLVDNAEFNMLMARLAYKKGFQLLITSALQPGSGAGGGPNGWPGTGLL